MSVGHHRRAPGAGLTLPDYFRPTRHLRNPNTYFPTAEELGRDEMRVSFVGSCPFPPRKNQAGTGIMVELGNGTRFFFDLGSGALRNIVGMQVPFTDINDIFLTHLHIDHYADLPYLYGFGPGYGRWSPLRVTGPSGRQPSLGTRAMVESMKAMMAWHTTSFELSPTGDGYEVDVTEFDWRDDGGVCYQKDGVEIRHWRRSHSMDGASAYRLDWNGMSFVWSGDGLPDELTAEYARDADVFVTETQLDVGRANELKFGLRRDMYDFAIDVYHTNHFALGYLAKIVNPRVAVVTHLTDDRDMLSELLAGVRVHWNGLFLLGTDVLVLNVTKDAIWAREAALPDHAHSASGSEGVMDGAVEIPPPRRTREQIQEAQTREYEIDPTLYYPPDLYRVPVLEWPSDD